MAAKQEDAIVQVFAREGTTTGRQGEKILTISDISLDVRLVTPLCNIHTERFLNVIISKG